MPDERTSNFPKTFLFIAAGWFLVGAIMKAAVASKHATAAEMRVGTDGKDTASGTSPKGPGANGDPDYYRLDPPPRPAHAARAPCRWVGQQVARRSQLLGRSGYSTRPRSTAAGGAPSSRRTARCSATTSPASSRSWCAPPRAPAPLPALLQSLRCGSRSVLFPLSPYPASLTAAGWCSTAKTTAATSSSASAISSRSISASPTPPVSEGVHSAAPLSGRSGTASTTAAATSARPTIARSACRAAPTSSVRAQPHAGAVILLGVPPLSHPPPPLKGAFQAP